MKSITKKYSNGEITIVWKPALCIHSEKCFHGLPTVFDPATRPWINAEGATSVEIQKQVTKCPSGALSYFWNDGRKETQNRTTHTLVETTVNGPLLVYGNLKIKDALGNETTRERVTAFCRCGHSGNKPFCDGTHKKANFKG